MKKSIALMLVIVFTLITAACGAKNNSSNSNNNEKSKFPEKNIEFVVGYNAGGGYSDWVQALAPVLEKHLPNKVKVVVRHMPGAASAIAAEYLQKAKPDGYIIGIYNMAGLAATQLTLATGYDLTKVTWLGKISSDDMIVAVNSKSLIKSMDDFKKQEKRAFILSTKGLSGTETINGAVTFAKMGVDWKPLNHDGTSESVLAVMRNDADVTWASYESIQQYISNGDLRPILIYRDEKHPDFPNVQIPADIGMPEIGSSLNAHRVIGAPPGLPAEVRSILEAAIKEAVDDPKFQESLKKMKRTSSYLDGAATEKLVLDTVKNYESYKDVVKELLK
jgi:tripartite-type tricarboxylate transporter receptor subunit TctC